MRNEPNPVLDPPAAAPGTTPAGHPDPRKARLPSRPASSAPGTTGRDDVDAPPPHKTMVPAADAPGLGYRGAPPTVTVLDRMYFSGGGLPAKAVTAAYSFRVRSDEQPYVRQAKLKTTDWAPLDPGWLDAWGNVSVACVECTAGVVEVSFVPFYAPSPAGTPAALVVFKGETTRFRVAAGVVPHVRAVPPAEGETAHLSPQETAAYTLTAFPA